MTVMNNDKERFKSAADNLKVEPQDSSWNRLETLLENDNLLQENKSYKNKMRWLSGIAASLLILGSVYFVSLQTEVESKQQVAYQIELIELEPDESNVIYDIDKLSILNDAQLWVNIVEGGPKIEAKKM